LLRALGFEQHIGDHFAGGDAFRFFA